MEPTGEIAEKEWSSLSGMFTSEEADFMAQLLGNNPFPNQVDFTSNIGFPSNFWPSNESAMNNMASLNESLSYSLDIDNTNLYHFSQGSSSCSYSGGTSVLFPTISQESYYLSDSHPSLINNTGAMPMDFCVGDVTNTPSFLAKGDGCTDQEMGNFDGKESVRNLRETAFPAKENSQAEKVLEMAAPDPLVEDKASNPFENSNKRPRSSRDAQKNKRNGKSKKRQKIVSTSDIDEESNAGLNGPASSSFCSEDDSNASQELNEGVSSSLSSKGTSALNLNGKTRAGRGAATEPQSLYARKRRERINARLRILQNLVPNGTKVDISTMLEEAVQYVKFLQLQIKLLSSDDLWMYAPIAYNGMDIGLDLKVTPSR